MFLIKRYWLDPIVPFDVGTNGTNVNLNYLKGRKVQNQENIVSLKKGEPKFLIL